MHGVERGMPGGRTDAAVQGLHDGLQGVQRLVDHRGICIRRRHLLSTTAEPLLRTAGA